MRVALVHDYLTQMGGAERVLEAFHASFPDAPVFTSIVDPAVLPAAWRSWDIRASALRFLPGAERWHRAVLPFYPLLFRGFGPALRGYDVVLSDSSAWAHQAPAGPDALHICYCHSPARFLHGDAAYLDPASIPAVLRPLARGLFSTLRAVDRGAARRVDRYIANSATVAERIRHAYGREAAIIYPPVDVERIGAVADRLPADPEAWYVVVSRLVPHKRVDLAIAAFNSLDIPLKVVGEGRSAERLRAMAGSDIEFLGRRGDDEVAALLARSRGLVLPAMEDFGITAVEAQAAGRPVIALDAGGAQETVIDGETGVLFPESSVSSLAAAVRSAERRSWDRSAIRANAARFDRARFQQEIAAEIAAVYGRRA